MQVHLIFLSKSKKRVFRKWTWVEDEQKIVISFDGTIMMMFLFGQTVLL